MFGFIRWFSGAVFLGRKNHFREIRVQFFGLQIEQNRRDDETERHADEREKGWLAAQRVDQKSEQK